MSFVIYLSAMTMIVTLRIMFLIALPMVAAFYLAWRFRWFVAKLIFVPLIVALFTFVLSVVMFKTHNNEEDIGIIVTMSLAIFYQIISSAIISIYYWRAK